MDKIFKISYYINIDNTEIYKFDFFSKTIGLLVFLIYINREKIGKFILERNWSFGKDGITANKIIYQELEKKVEKEKLEPSHEESDATLKRVDDRLSILYDEMDNLELDFLNYLYGKKDVFIELSKVEEMLTEKIKELMCKDDSKCDFLNYEKFEKNKVENTINFLKVNDIIDIEYTFVKLTETGEKFCNVYL